MNAAPIYDLVLKDGHVICPASGIDGVMDVAVADGKIALVGSDILPSTARRVVDVRGKLVLPGMIDTHAHIYPYVPGPFAPHPDLVAAQPGLTPPIHPPAPPYS